MTTAKQPKATPVAGGLSGLKQWIRDHPKLSLGFSGILIFLVILLILRLLGLL